MLYITSEHHGALTPISKSPPATAAVRKSEESGGSTSATSTSSLMRRKTGSVKSKNSEENKQHDVADVDDDGEGDGKGVVEKEEAVADADADSVERRRQLRVCCDRDVKKSTCRMSAKNSYQNGQTHRTAMTLLVGLLEYLLYPVFKLALLFWYMPVALVGMCRRKRTCGELVGDPPPNMRLPGCRLASMIANQEVSCKQVIEEYITRIKAVNPLINAVVEERFDTALQEAISTDTKIHTSGLTAKELLAAYPLLGVPFTVKESLGVEGMSSTAGCFNAAGRRAERDADVVEMVRRYGAIVLAVTNTPELCMNWETFNRFTGLTVNPFDSRRTVGGSSGGEGALLGAGASLIGLGSDVAGSLRLPAHYCGVFSLKPTAGVVSSRGHYPSCTNVQKWDQHFSIGPLARYATDLLPVMKLIIKDEFRAGMNLDREIDIGKVKIYYTKRIDSVLCANLDSEISSQFDFVLDHFKIKHNLKVEKLRKNFFQRTIFPVINTLVEMDGVDDYANGQPKRNLFVEFFRVLFGFSKVALSTICYEVLRKYATTFPQSIFRKSNIKIAAMQDELEKLLGDDGVLLIPTSHRTADYHYTSLPRVLEVTAVMVFNALGVPAANCPIGWHSNGLPFSIQVVGKRLNDRLPMAVAEEIEKICGGWRPPQAMK